MVRRWSVRLATCSGWPTWRCAQPQPRGGNCLQVCRPECDKYGMPKSIPSRIFCLVRCAVLCGLHLLALPATAVQKCTAPDGRISYQDSTCPTQGKTLVLEEPFRTLGASPSGTGAARQPPARSDQATRAVASGLPYVGMTAAALERLMGPPDRISRTSYSDGATQDRSDYRRHGRVLRVYVVNGKVVEVQNRAAPQEAASAPCPTAQDIRNMETKAGNRTDPPERVAENKRLLREMRACQ